MAMVANRKTALFFASIFVVIALSDAGELFEGCTWVDKTLTDPRCFTVFECNPDSVKIHALEECPSNDDPWFTVVDKIEVGEPCDPVVSLKNKNPNQISLETPFDLEEVNRDNFYCENFFIVDGVHYIASLQFVDVDEYSPFPASGPTQSQLKVDENAGNILLDKIKYKDNDYGETATLDATLVFPDPINAPSIEISKYVTEDYLEVQLWVRNPLDYEKNNFYEFNIEFTSKDGVGGSRSSDHKVYLLVQDKGDTPPIWVNPVFFVKFPEGDTVRSVFNVSARDGDFVVNNEVRYHIVEESTPGYFEINLLGGEVTNKEPIDYDTLQVNGITFFTLTLKATETDIEGNEAPPPNSSFQNVTISIEDINDQCPTFSEDYVQVTVAELTEDVSFRPIIEDMVYIIDTDTGSGGRYNLEADEGLTISPSTSSGNTTIKVQISKTNGIDFDYEEIRDTPRKFTITAVEVANQEHKATLVLEITLRDQNDNAPEFEEVSYLTTVLENQDVTEPFLTVSATDGDIFEDFGNLSIRYSLPDCKEKGIRIHAETGAVSVEEGALDHEDSEKSYFECTLLAQDLKGDPQCKKGTSLLKIFVDDVNDTPPEIVELRDADVDENSAEGTYVTTVLVNDKDTTAEIEFALEVAAAKDHDENPISDLTPLQSWFKVVEVSDSLKEMVDGPVEESKMTPSGNDFTAEIQVSTGELDYETAIQVTLLVTVKDLNTEKNIDSVSKNVRINLNDLNDVTPLLNIPANLEVEENQKDKNISWIDGVDPDTDDELTFSCRDNDYVTIDNMNGRGMLKTKPDAKIDREVMDNFTVIVEVTDKEMHGSSALVNVKVLDVNDEKPFMNSSTCPGTKNISEMTPNNTIVYQVYGSDPDQGINGEVRFHLLSDSSPASKDLMTPFRLDAKTGEVFVLKDGQRKDLDRETYSFWELSIYPSDCGDGGGMNCAVIQGDTCIVTINLLDVNDNDPEFPIQKPPLVTRENVKKDTNIGRLTTVEDKDEPNTPNSKISCELVKTTTTNYMGDEEEVNLFEAVTNSYLDNDNVAKFECQLRTLEDLEHQQGKYNVTLKATDYGDVPNSSEDYFDVIILDENDSEPHLVMEGCLEQQSAVVYVTENEGDPEDLVLCTSSNPTLGYVTFVVEDGDTSEVNGELTVTIDWEKTDIQGAILEKREVFKVEKTPDQKFHLVFKEKVDRERGSHYNLSLTVEDHGEPQLKTESWIVVEVKDTSEWEPFFCEGDKNCKLEISMEENNTDVNAAFTEAKDFDTGGDDIIYYMLVPDSPVFRIQEETSPSLSLKENTTLDREETDRYSLNVVTSNKFNKPSEAPTGNMTLELTVVVKDINDVSPSFRSDVVLTSFLESDVTSKIIPEAFKGYDADAIDSHTCYAGDTFTWHGATENISKPFIIKSNSVNDLACDVTLDFNPTAQTGYCTFDLFLKDAADHVGKTQAKIYIITSEFINPFDFLNNKTYVATMKEELVEGFNIAFGYSSSLDGIEDYIVDGVTISGRCTVRLHFIDLEKNEPVSKNVILKMMADPKVTNALRSNLLKYNLVLATSDDKDVATPAQDVRLYQILLGVVSLVLGCFVLLLLSAYCVRTRSLQRRVKALTTNTFGSSESVRKLQEPDPVPGSNLYSGEMVNPVWSMDAPTESQSRRKDRDTASIGSGDSVLVGVEDNPEFRDFKGKGGNGGGKSKGITNSAFTKSIDQISAPPPGLGGGARINPLLAAEMGDSSPTEEKDLSDGLHEFNFGRKGSSHVEEDLSTQLNSNFSFGKPPSSTAGTSL
ncbi:cadherin-AgCad1-like [Oratosquilla oratoria]|uniref:cadherin-AgCad1-like n=1 Tax=Oratosquilla oratoria TaxID=337810 RepID=UPI003F76007C